MYPSHEQIEIDKLVYEVYGLNAEDIAEVENWYARRYPIQNYLKLKKPTCVNLNTMSESRIRWIKGLHGFLEVKRIKIREISAIRLIRVLTLNWIKRLHGLGCRFR
ncbi:hypothetical protein AA650_20795 [Anabaena sp. WA102]|nr:hypothetical protein AA650_20795 [Anabaena sp. WA102]